MIHLLAQAADAAQTGNDWPAIIVAIFAGIMSLLQWWAKQRTASERDALIEGVERIPDEGARAAAKRSVSEASVERGLADRLDATMKRHTGRL